MSEAKLRQVRVLHVVSSGALAGGLQQALFMPLLTRTPKDRVKAQIVCLAPGDATAAILRQSGVPVHEVPLSRRRFSPAALSDLVRAARAFRPDIIQAWGLTAQIASIIVRKRCEVRPKVLWSISQTVPLPRGAGLIDRQKLKWAARLAARADRIVYASEAAAAHHRRAGFPESGSLTIPPGIDAARFKTDPEARQRIREQLQIEDAAFVIGMVAPFQPEYDHATLLKAAGELIKTNPQIALVLAGHGVQKGNAALMALLGSSTLGARTQLLGEWSDVCALFNACDVVCSSALNDGSRMSVAMAMLCGVPCVATGMGAQGEVLGQSGIAIEPGSPAAFIKGIGRVMQLPEDKRAAMTQGARKHVLKHYVYVRSLQQYLEAYHDLIGRTPAAPEAAVVQANPAEPVQARSSPATQREVEPSVAKAQPAVRTQPDAPPVSPKAPSKPMPKPRAKPQATVLAEPSDPDSLETLTTENAELLPKWRIEQEERRRQHEQQISRQIESSPTAGDVLASFEAELAKPVSRPTSPMAERARGVAEDVGDLLSPEMLTGTLEALAPAPESKLPAPRDTEQAATASSQADAQPQQLALIDGGEPAADAADAEAPPQLELLDEPRAAR